MDQANNGQSKASFLIQPVGLRDKVVPRLPENSFGNFWCLATSQLGPGEGDKINLIDFYKILHGSVKKTIRDCAKILTDGEEGYGVVINPYLESNRKIDDSDVDFYLFTCWCKFSFYNADFGSGKTIWASTGKLPCQNLVIMMDDNEGDGVEAWVHLDDKRMKELAQDYDIKAYATLSALVFGYARKGLVKEAREADGTTVSCVLSAVGELGVYDTWCGSAVEILRVFDEMGCKHVGACNALILGFSRNGLTNEALEVFKRLRSQEPELSVLSWTCVIASRDQISQNNVKKKHFFRNFMTIMLFGVVGTVISFTIISFGAINIFSRMNIGSLELGDYLAIGAIFSATDYVCTLQVDGTTASSVLSAVGELGDLGVLSDTWMSVRVMLLISGFSRNGLTDEALEVFKESRTRVERCVVNVCYSVLLATWKTILKLLSFLEKCKFVE
uniref:Pelargonidin 3-O-(6-caffeoylglucoside) 5-O-(6-O-malonylglucoside) 4'''-malonyltransferase-like n=1 Tax=Tanacetum cinerariifolium TaxID=118510 RepID=A0A6L2KYC1_TANCI|nr:pelargonidin 3-O-(6-caffeoylglucoside) 5-O-(6-O-malonylglucoside) 4'''-malonyltransferase-like [Tanacetum cinerariifolium]